MRLPQAQENAVKDYPWHLHITDTEFSDMNFCGSLVSNDAMTFRNAETKAVAPQTLAQQNCGEVECWSFNFSKNSVKNLNLLKRKTPQSYFKEKVNR